MSLTIGELCAGYGGLGMGVQAVLGGEVAWVSDIDKGANKILAHRFPGVPNIGDMTAVDWRDVQPVDVLCGGTPCQDLSHAGKRAGMTEGTRSNLWVSMREAIATLRPSLVVWENVGGAFSAAATSEVEPCAGCLGDGGDESALRALHRVLGDLASLGFDAEWVALRAADVGAPHGRLRVFLAAWPADSDPCCLRRGAWRPTVTREAARGWASADTAGRGDTPLLGTPRASEYKGSGPVGSKSHAHMLEREYLSAQVLSLMPTPRATDGTKGGPGQRGSSGDLAIEAQRLLPTPRALDGTNVCGVTPNRTDEDNARAGITLHDISRDDKWGDYADAIARWEALTRPAPEPTQLSKKGTPQLSARFSEWLMGLADGWVTDVPGVTRNEALKALGNGVVPQQAAAALRFLLAHQETAA